MAIFFIAGMMYASWGVHVPTVRDKFALSPGMLSFALLAVGSIFAMLTAGSWIARVGTRNSCLAGGGALVIFGALILLTPYITGCCWSFSRCLVSAWRHSMSR